MSKKYEVSVLVVVVRRLPKKMGDIRAETKINLDMLKDAKHPIRIIEHSIEFTKRASDIKAKEIMQRFG